MLPDHLAAVLRDFEDDALSTLPVGTPRLAPSAPVEVERVGVTGT